MKNLQTNQNLLRVKDEFDARIESLELMKSKTFMDSYKETKEQVKRRDFDEWNAL